MNMGKLREHKVNCAQCANHPFNLCGVGKLLLDQAGGAGDTIVDFGLGFKMAYPKGDLKPLEPKLCWPNGAPCQRHRGCAFALREQDCPYNKEVN